MIASGYGFDRLITALLALSLLTDRLVFRTAQVDISPPEALPLGGYTERGEKILAPGGESLFARTILFEKRNLRIALVSIEMLTVPESLFDEVQKRIPKDINLMLVATHTHSAPDSQMLNERMNFKVPGIASFKRRWLDWYSEKIAQSVNEAVMAKAIDAAHIKVITAEVDANHGRRTGALPDKSATWLSMGGKPILTIFSAHGTVLDSDNLLTSGDWPGVYAASQGGMVLPGAIGDASPNLVGPTSVEKLQNIVEKLKSGFAIGQVVDQSLYVRSLGFIRQPISLDKPVPHPDFSKSYGAAKPFDQVLIDKFAPKTAFVTALQIGGLLLIGIPGEPTSDIGRKIQKFGLSLGFPHTVVVSHCNGWIGYVLEPEDYDRGGYEATLSFHGRNTAKSVIEAASLAITQLFPSREVQVR